MTEVVLNDKCMHCNNRECHDGYNFCNQAMKDNSFYKNAKLYKGLEVIHRPTYEELEKENAELQHKVDTLQGYLDHDIEFDMDRTIQELRKENAELKDELKKWKDEWQEQIQKANNEGYARTLQTIQLSKAKEIIKDLLSFVDSLGNYSGGIFAKAEQFLKDLEK